jgi:hypothetical protein
MTDNGLKACLAGCFMALTGLMPPDDGVRNVLRSWFTLVATTKGPRAIKTWALAAVAGFLRIDALGPDEQATARRTEVLAREEADRVRLGEG